MTSDKQFLVVAGLGPDRPGLVASIAEHVTRRGGNVEESRMAILGGDFGVMVVIDGTPDQLAIIERELPELAGKTGLEFMHRRTHQAVAENALACEIVATAIDREGIVHTIAESLQKLGVNIRSLETSSYPAAETGAPLFRFEAVVDVPRGLGIHALREQMREAAKRFDLDIAVEATTS